MTVFICCRLTENYLQSRQGRNGFVKKLLLRFVFLLFLLFCFGKNRDKAVKSEVAVKQTEIIKGAKYAQSTRYNTEKNR